MVYGVCLLMSLKSACVCVYKQRPVLLKVNFNTRKTKALQFQLLSTLKICPWVACQGQFFFPWPMLMSFTFSRTCRFGLPFIVRVLRELSYEELQAALLKAMSRILIDDYSSEVMFCQFFWVNLGVVNPFTPKGFPIDKLNHLALDKVNSASVSGTYRSEKESLPRGSPLTSKIFWH